MLASALFFSIEGIEEIQDDEGCESCTITITGNNSNSYTVSQGDVVCIVSGATFSGSIQRNSSSGSGEVRICNQGTISGASMSFNKGENYVDNFGIITSLSLQFNGGTSENEFINHEDATATFSSMNFSSSNTEIINEGTLNSGSITLSSGASFHNQTGAMVSSGNVQLNSNTELENEGTWHVSGNIAVNSNAELENEGTMTVTGDVENNKSLNSEGTLSVGGNFSINGSAVAELYNIVSIGGNLNVNKTLRQEGTLTLTGNMTVNGGGNATVLGHIDVGGNLTNNSKIYGQATSSGLYGSIAIQGMTTQNGGAKLFGNLDICDAGSPVGGMDTNWGSAEPSVTYCQNAPIGMPVEWLAFEATPTAAGVELMWMTAMEQNNDFFTVERSTDALVFEAITKVQGVGNSTEPVEYQATDPAPFSGSAYYRIRQTDFDGKTSFTNQVEVTFELESTFSFSLYPNPVKEVANLEMLASEGSQVQVCILSMNGQELKREQINLNAGKNRHQLQVSDLPAGIYIVQIRDNVGTISSSNRMIKQ